MENNITIQQAADLIKKGTLVAFPTETVYGLGADAFNPIAVAKIFEVKERPSFDPLIVHISKLEDVELLFEDVDNRIFKLAEKFWPGPLTIVKQKKKTVPDLVTSGLSTVAVRMPANPIALELISKAGTPIAAPSANKFGMLSPTKAEHVKKQLPEISCVLDGGKTSIGLESTVIELNDDGFRLLRPGAITEIELEEVVPKSKLNSDKTKLKSPGLLKSHYSPRKPIYIIGESDIEGDLTKAGLITFANFNVENKYKRVEVLSPNRNLNEAAVNLFSAMHKLEDADVDFIVAESVPEFGIGIAIMDRLRKASFKYKLKSTAINNSDN